MIFETERIGPQDRKLQEAMFELITSEASYLRSLNVLTTHFMNSNQFNISRLVSLSPTATALATIE